MSLVILMMRIIFRISCSFCNNSSANIKLSKTQLHKTGRSGQFLGRFLGPLPKNGLASMKNVLKPLVKTVLILLQLTGAASTIDAAIHKKMFGSDTHLSDLAKQAIISNEKVDNIMKIVKPFQE